jgi:hypothetical protein
LQCGLCVPDSLKLLIDHAPVYPVWSLETLTRTATDRRTHAPATRTQLRPNLTPPAGTRPPPTSFPTLVVVPRRDAPILAASAAVSLQPPTPRRLGNRRRAYLVAAEAGAARSHDLPPYLFSPPAFPAFSPRRRSSLGSLVGRWRSVRAKDRFLSRW